MGLFTNAIVIRLLEAERAQFNAVPVKDEGGGPQRLYRQLEAMGAGTHGVLTMEDDLARKINRYAYAYGNGSYQQAFRQVTAALRRAGWTGNDPAPTGTRPASGKSWDGK